MPADEQTEYDLEKALSEVAGAKNILVLREGGKPSLLDRVKAFFTRSPIEAVTLVADVEPEEGAEIETTARETELPGVYVATDTVRIV